MFDGDSTVTIMDDTVITKENLMLVTNTTTNEILYNFGCEGFGGTLDGQVLTLERTATDGAITDSLQIILYQEEEIGEGISDIELNTGESRQTLRNISVQLTEIKDLLKLILS
jgi:hypothetical protein